MVHNTGEWMSLDVSPVKILILILTLTVTEKMQFNPFPIINLKNLSVVIATKQKGSSP